MTLVGASPEELERAAQQLDEGAAQLDRSAKELSATLGSFAWLGRAAIAFTDSFSGRHKPRMLTTASFLRDNARNLRLQAQQQRQASQPGGSGGGATVGILDREMALVGGLFSPGTPIVGSLAAAIVAMGPAAVQVLQAADFVSDIPRNLRFSHVLAVLNANRAAIGRAPVSAAEWIRVAGGKVPLAGTLLSVADVALNWNQHGLWDSRTQGAIGLGALGAGAAALAGGPGSLAFAAGTTIGQVICATTPIDENLASGTLSMAYGHRVVQVEERSAEWYRTATPEMIAADTARAHEASLETSRVVERTQKPWLLFKDWGEGLGHRIGGLLVK